MGVGPTTRAWAADEEGATPGRPRDGRMHRSSWGKKDDGESSWSRMQNANKDMRSS
ncbi:hypothetical protein YC2023_002742 [Brassica napus]